ncbi:MAG: hypothetical protein A2849_01795 [Candidatus Taylorbacteria bacterium RIFCSPHIGHO2_01_FULL_51_15]|uniref:Uncharacterized protein n=1 Tax=Candidatus Taylorbacteria bacterium RIFCSPHIGHO2_01_FULL_51_15 TaxID=1802304 RepID=A0A1G2MAT9_9BACT|nr:MAG: hypothetical protein A2849_01795 [Candidatus Taylorbacteria bacterium RIFCSPHIGHO2_01_FULL_51_15]
MIFDPSGSELALAKTHLAGRVGRLICCARRKKFLRVLRTKRADIDFVIIIARGNLEHDLPTGTCYVELDARSGEMFRYAGKSGLQHMVFVGSDCLRDFFDSKTHERVSAEEVLDPKSGKLTRTYFCLNWGKILSIAELEWPREGRLVVF